jgi:hypothetical protein
MMIFANKASCYISNLLNRKFGNSNVSFTYTILPVAYQNYEKYVDIGFKLAQSGYSLLLPAIAMGMSQRDICDIKDLENDVLKLGEKLIPPSSAYTQSAATPSDEGKGATDEGGKPPLEDGEKSDKTLEKETSLEKNGGGS